MGWSDSDLAGPTRRCRVGSAMSPHGPQATRSRALPARRIGSCHASDYLPSARAGPGRPGPPRVSAADGHDRIESQDGTLVWRMCSLQLEPGLPSEPSESEQRTPLTRNASRIKGRRGAVRYPWLGEPAGDRMGVWWMPGPGHPAPEQLPLTQSILVGSAKIPLRSPTSPA